MTMNVSRYFDYTDPGGERRGDLVFLADLPDEGWHKLLSYTNTVRFPAGGIVIRAGESDRALYIVTAGTLEVLAPAPNGRGEQRVTTIDSGSVLGEVSFFDGRPRSASIRAVTDSELLRLSTERFEILAAREPALARAMLFDLGRILAARLRQTAEMMANAVG